MNYYEHHIGDFDADTAHLTWVEDMAYTRLIRLYYRREKQIPANVAEACRLVRAQTREQKQAVESVLSEFFELRDDGWHQSRCDSEIALYQKRVEHNQRVGKLGGRPRKTETHKEPTENPPGYFREPEKNPPQTPDTRHHISKEEIHTTHHPNGRVSESEISPNSAASIAMRNAGISSVSPQHPELIALVRSGVAPDQFAQAATQAVAKGKGFSYAIGILKGQLREANAITESGLAMPEKPWDESRLTIEAEGVRLGIGKWDEVAFHSGRGEVFPVYEARVRTAREKAGA